MRFTVERSRRGAWETVDPDVLASGARQAIARTCAGAGIYRANPFGTKGLNELFAVPRWGAPAQVKSQGRHGEIHPATYEAIREAAGVAGARARLGCERALENRTLAARLLATSVASRRARVEVAARH